ncbi:hypothetical protein CVT26_007443 [Gymnopilus dilepis]|uniref:IPT/TIG domain-containing protein n=1 Tax=Gymnopilus dilepis TaxID=231916 RepID=A0A409W7Z9_9AGAR|nr:hypothetical protein CVT26_007443 [Gymnopilus dilepis]
MIMNFKLSVASVLATLMMAQTSFAAPLDIFDPRIISPNASTVWTIGKTELVTWDTSDAPKHISNLGSVFLSGYGTLVKPIDLLAGNVSIVVPESVTPGTHTITLYGDSGDISPPFQIVAA